MSAATFQPAGQAPPPVPPSAPGEAGRRPHEPAIVRPGRNPRARSKVRVQWLALAAALIVLAGTLVAWALSRAGERVSVVAVARPVQAGDIITVDDLTISDVAIDADVRGLVPATSLERLAGRVATIDLATGMLISTGMWAQEPELQPDERTVGAVLAAGRYPSGLTHGSAAWAIDVRNSTAASTGASTATATAASTSTGASDATTGTTTDTTGTTTDTTGTTGTDAGQPIVVRVLDADVDEAGELHVTLAVPADAAVEIASLAATDTLALAGIPDPQVVTTSSVPDGAP